MKNSKMIIILILMCFLVSLISITASKISAISKIENKMKNSSGEKKIKIGVSMGTLKEERWLKDRAALKLKIKQMGAEAIIKNANNDDAEQIKQVQNLIKQDIDVLILVANDQIKAKEAVKYAYNAKVPVILYDRLVLNTDAAIYVSFDNEAVGEVMASALLKKLGKGKILIINGDPDDNNTNIMRNGYYNVLKEHVDNGDIEIVKEVWAEDWMQEEAFLKTNELLNQGIEIDGVIAGNDSLAGGVIRALAEHRLAGKVYVTGQDADLDGCQRIIEGTQLMTVYKSMDDMAEAAVKIALDIVNGKKIYTAEEIRNGDYLIPNYVISVKGVDQSNMEETVIKDKFHDKEEVYR